MTSSINKAWVAAIAVTLVLFALIARADFDEATKAYLLGQYEQARYEALIAATDGNPKAQMLLGQLYFNGEGVPKDIPHALHWYNKAAENGFADAQFRLGLLYHDGSQGVERNYNLAYKWLSKAQENGNTTAREKLEWLFKTEQGNVVNLNENVEVLKQVAASGNQQARFLLSQKLIKGTGVPQDKVSAVRMLREDAELGFVKAQKQLGELFYYGDGVDKDYIEAYAWSMAYAGTRELGGIAREGKQTARSALRKLPEEEHEKAYIKSREYFESFVSPFHKNAREVGPDKYRIVVRSDVKKDTSPQPPATQKSAAQSSAAQQSGDKPVTAGRESVDTVSPAVPATSLGDNSSNTVPDENQKLPAPNSAAKSGQSETPVPDSYSDQDKVTSSAVTSVNTDQKPDESQKKIADEMSDKVPTSTSTTPENIKSEKEDKSPQPGKASGSEEKNTSRPVASREDLEVISSTEPAAVKVGDGTKVNAKVVAERKFEDVYNVLVQKKSALYQLYTREYELDKKLQGRVVFEVVILPDGKISTVEITSNTLESPTLEQEFIDYLKANVSFPSAEVAEFKITYPVDFLPPL